MEEIMGMALLEDAFGCQDVTSPKMRQAIREWFRLYYDRNVREDYDPCLQIPYTVVRKLTRAVFSEYRTQCTGSCTGKILEGLNTCKSNAMELMLIGGECYLKPVTDGNSWSFRVMGRQQVLVFGRDVMGNVTDIGTAERSSLGKYTYTLLERRTLEQGRLVLRNRLFRSASPDGLGREVSLHCHPGYAALPERFVFPEKMEGIGLLRLKNPAVNCIDGGPEGISVYAPAVGLIRSLGRNEAELNGEFARGKSRIVVSADMLRDGILQDSIFVGLDEAPEDVGITAFAPPLRTDAYFARKQAYLRDLENIIGLKRGILSQVEAIERTATEITSSEGEYALAILDFQRAWQQLCLETVRVCRSLARCYGMETDEKPVDFFWGNGVLFDTPVQGKEGK